VNFATSWSENIAPAPNTRNLFNPLCNGATECNFSNPWSEYDKGDAMLTAFSEPEYEENRPTQ
jgi:hypothetical protein